MGNTITIITSYFYPYSKSEINNIRPLDNVHVEYLQSQTLDHITLDYTQMFKSRPKRKKTIPSLKPPSY